MRDCVREKEFRCAKERPACLWSTICLCIMCLPYVHKFGCRSIAVDWHLIKEITHNRLGSAGLKCLLEAGEIIRD
jgi:hypothetical protein